MEDYIQEILFTNEEISARCREIGNKISEEYEGKRPLMIGVLKGAVPFMSELMKHITCDMDIEFLGVSSYSGVNSTGNCKITKDVDQDLTGKDVIIVEDIVDTGLTLKTVSEIFKVRGAKSVIVVCLLDKKEGRKVTGLDVKYSCFDCPNKFVVGFGLDYDELYRNLPYVGVLKPSVYQK